LLGRRFLVGAGLFSSLLLLVERRDQLALEKTPLQGFPI
jgi:hypothetical protein